MIPLDKLIPDEDKRRRFLELNDMPYGSDFLIFLPQCIRSDYCRAEVDKGVIVCHECGQERKDGDYCPVKSIKEEVAELAAERGLIGDVYVIRGRGIVNILLETGKPRKIFGMACGVELPLGEAIVSYLKDVEVAGFPLSGKTPDGCSETTFDKKGYTEKLEELLR